MLMVIVLIGVLLFFWLKDMIAVRANTTKKDAYMVIQVNNLEPNHVQALAVGDVVIGENGRQKDVIEAIEVTDADMIAEAKDGELYAAKDPTKKNMTIGMKCRVRVSGPYMTCGGQEAKIGLSYTIYTHNAELVGMIQDIKFD